MNRIFCSQSDPFRVFVKMFCLENKTTTQAANKKFIVLVHDFRRRAKRWWHTNRQVKGSFFAHRKQTLSSAPSQITYNCREALRKLYK